ncbi:MAG: hypothetical protein J3K34DRAFT_423842 [Monoraphidium minutum]|nr:MAG: hypothetical protein J3K34DRAFT_423842 [Monoraphidium minutum]
MGTFGCSAAAAPRPSPRRAGALAAPAAAARRAVLPPLDRRRRAVAVRAAEPGADKAAGAEPQEEVDGLLPEEDVEVPGTYFDALNRNTRLGKAVAAAVDELEHLSGMEMESLSKADDLLKKLGLKSSLFGEAGGPPPPLPKEEEDDGEDEQ